MKPDPGKKRDKARLDDKKAKKAAAKAARKASTSTEAESSSWEEQIRRLRGANRVAAWKAACKLDAPRAVAFVRALVDAGAEGRNLQELGALLLSRGDEAVVDDALRGRFGPLSIAEHAPTAVDGALQRLHAQLHRLPLDLVEQRLAALGALGAHAPRSAAPLLAALLDDARIVERPALAVVVAEALVVLDPGSLWLSREHAPLHLAVIAGLASGRLADDAAWVDGFVAYVGALTAEAQRVALRMAKLPASSATLPPAQRFALLRACALHGDAGAAADATEALWRDFRTTARQRVVDVVLAVPDANVVVTVDVCAALDFDEAWEIIGPRFGVREVRDRFFSTPHRGAPRLLDVVLPLLVDDPVCAAAYLRENLDPRAREELVAACAAADDNGLRDLLQGVVTPTLGPTSRQRPHVLSGLLAALAPSPWSPLLVRCLRAWRPRAGAHVFAVDACLDRLQPD